MSLVWDPDTAAARRDSVNEAEARFLKAYAGVDRAERVALWREWAAKKLIAEFPMPADPAARRRLVGQCTAELEKMVRQLFSRGWLLEGKLLRDVVNACLAPIAEANRAGKVRDFYPHFCRAVAAYVPVNAEQIQRNARGAGATAGQAFSAGLAMALAQLRDRAPSITEDIAEHTAEARQAACKPAATRRGRPRIDRGAGTGDLFGGA